MFNITEAKFILNSAERDLKTLEDRVEDATRMIAESGVRLSEMRETRGVLSEIVNKIKSAVEEDESEE